MIKTYEGLGGWTIEVVKGKTTTRLECAQYAYKDKDGITWFDFDRAMHDARKLDAEQRSSKKVISHE